MVVQLWLQGIEDLQGNAGIEAVVYPFAFGRTDIGGPGLVGVDDSHARLALSLTSVWLGLILSHLMLDQLPSKGRSCCLGFSFVIIS